MERVIDVDAWTLTSSELALIAGKRAANRLDVAVLLKCFQQHARFPASTLAADPAVVAFLAEQLGTEPTLRTLSGRTPERVRAEIRRFYGYREATVQDARHLTIWLRENTVALTRNHDQLIEALENECRKRRIEPPTVERLERIARSAVRAYEERFYAQRTNLQENTLRSGWYSLKWPRLVQFEVSAGGRERFTLAHQLYEPRPRGTR